MAGGIDWFRWHHGSVTDPKFGLVAKKAGCRVGDVIAVWAFLLEAASSSHERGHIGQPDFEAMDHLFGLEDGQSLVIFNQMGLRGLVADGRISNWEKRQPKREDDTAAERKRRQREREHEMMVAGVVTDELSRNVTQCHTEVTLCHDREEESREEKKDKGIAPRKREAAPLSFRPEDVSEQVWSDWLSLRKQKKATVTQTVVQEARKEAALAGLTLQRFLEIWCLRGSQGLKAAWLKDEEKLSAEPSTDWRKSNPIFAGAI